MAGLATYLSRNHYAIWNSASTMKHNGLLRRVLCNEEHKGPQKMTLQIRTNMIPLLASVGYITNLQGHVDNFPLGLS
jgi:hypothetical protein